MFGLVVWFILFFVNYWALTHIYQYDGGKMSDKKRVTFFAISIFHGFGSLIVIGFALNSALKKGFLAKDDFEFEDGNPIVVFMRFLTAIESFLKPKNTDSEDSEDSEE